jgi:hypothetical protein
MIAVVILPAWLAALWWLATLWDETQAEERQRHGPRTPSPRERQELDRHAAFLAQERERLGLDP